MLPLAGLSFLQAPLQPSPSRDVTPPWGAPRRAAHVWRIRVLKNHGIIHRVARVTSESLFEVALKKYALDDHVRTTSPSNPDAQWILLDALVHSWLYIVISFDLIAMVMDSTASAYDIWTRITGLYRDNTETCSIYLEQEFHSLMEGSMTVVDYCRKQKTLVDELMAVGTMILDWSLVLNTHHGFNSQFTHMHTLLSMQRPTPSLLETCSILILKERTLNSFESSLPMTFFANSSDNSKSSSVVSSQGSGGGQQHTNSSKNHANDGGFSSSNNNHCRNGGNSKTNGGASSSTGGNR
ncbi:uncharacterized protein LOC133918115 [Phragmites australis]|uniref:uncharacterized protein LOC133918115 n=1 Tax=Phragmites australis TaxID=29695 RepID=UPI002D781020|nr:uncharacterized protein LOC133918115 [Phragmites australis]